MIRNLKRLLFLLTLLTIPMFPVSSQQEATETVTPPTATSQPEAEPKPFPEGDVIGVSDPDPLGDVLADGLENLFEYFVRNAVGGAVLITFIVRVLKSIPLLDPIPVGVLAFLVALAVYALTVLSGRLGYGLQFEQAVNLLLDNWYTFAVLLFGTNRVYEWAKNHDVAVLGNER